MITAAPHPDPLPGGERENPSTPLAPAPSTPLAPPGRGAGGEGNGGRLKTRSKSDLTPILKSFAKEMRQAPTDAEGRLWYFLRDRRMAGHKFRRQHPVGSYIVDFICIDAKLVVELDGGQHGDQAASDAERTRFLESRGLHVLRFWNNDVLSRGETVLEEIWRVLEASTATPHPSPLPGGERE